MQPVNELALSVDNAYKYFGKDKKDNKWLPWRKDNGKKNEENGSKNKLA